MLGNLKNLLPFSADKRAKEIFEKGLKKAAYNPEHPVKFDGEVQEYLTLIQELIASVYRIYAKTGKQVQVPVPKDFYFSLMNDMSVNAIAFEHKKQENVGINAGLILFFRDIALTIFGSSNFLRTSYPFIGQPLTEAADMRVYFSNFPFTEGGIELGKFAPVPDDRFFKGDTLATIGHYFVFFHELGHIMLGHTYLNGLLINSQDNSVTEKAYLRQNMIDIALLRNLEIKADNFAIARTVTLLMGSPESFSLEDKSQEDRIHLYFLATNLLFLLLNIYNKDEEFCLIDEHPHAADRAKYSYMAATAILEEHYGVLKDKCKELFKRSLAEAHEFWDFIGLPSVGYDHPDSAMHHLPVGDLIDPQWADLNTAMLKKRFEQYGLDLAKYSIMAKALLEERRSNKA